VYILYIHDWVGHFALLFELFQRDNVISFGFIMNYICMWGDGCVYWNLWEAREGGGERERERERERELSKDPAKTCKNKEENKMWRRHTCMMENKGLFWIFKTFYFVKHIVLLMLFFLFFFSNLIIAF